MTIITLVRHGLASFGESDYDKLSDLGLRQGQIVGEAFKERNLNPEETAIYYGSQLRHKETMEQAFKVWPYDGESNVLKGVREFDHEDIIFKGHPNFASKALLGAKLLASKDKKKTLEKLFFEALKRWFSGQFDHEYRESWIEFEKRCWNSVRDVGLQKERKEIVIFTSGGVIAAIVKVLMNIDHDKVLDILWKQVNGGITKILFQDNAYLLSWNEQHHILKKGKNFLTYK